jgi:hypothetical protein
MKFNEIKVAEVTHDELDMFYPFYGPEKDKEGDEIRNEISFNNDVWGETESIDIDIVIKTLQELKELGSERVYIIAHTDNHGYIFTGVKYEEI